MKRTTTAKRTSTAKVTAAAVMALLLVCMYSITAFAAGPNPLGTGSSDTASSAAEATPTTTSTSAASPGTPEFNSILAKARFDELGGGNVGPDPILNMVPLVGYGLKNQDGVVYGTSTNSTTSDFVSSPDGFQKLYMDHNGVGRLYYRTYSATQGWSAWSCSQENTTGGADGSRVQAIQIRSKGYIHNLADIYYKAVLNDGTVVGWAKNGQTLGTMGTDKYIVGLKVTLMSKGSSIGHTGNLMLSNSYEGITKFGSGKPTYSTYDGRKYTGWAFDEDSNQYWFQAGNCVTGWNVVDGYKYYMDESGKVVEDLEPIMGLPGNYNIRYNKSTRTMYVMAADPDGGGYIIPFKTFKSSCGPDTPVGTFSTYAKYDWKYMHDAEDGSGAIYCQKLTRFKDHFLIHSLLYYKEPSPYALDAINYNFIDDAASGGCIRLTAGDATWFYNNVPMGTPVIVYQDLSNKGPVEKPCIETPIPREQNYDPTDPVVLGQAQQNAEAQAAAEAEAAAGTGEGQ